MIDPPRVVLQPISEKTKTKKKVPFFVSLFSNRAVRDKDDKAQYMTDFYANITSAMHILRYTPARCTDEVGPVLTRVGKTTSIMDDDNG